MEPASRDAIVIVAAGAGVIAILASAAIERFGGRRGGALATMPSTIVFASWGLYQVDQGENFVKSMAAIPVGMLLSTGVLAIWRVLPHRLHALSSASRLLVTTIFSIVIWIACAVVIADVQRATNPAPGAASGAAVVWGVVALLVTLAMGLLLSRQNIPALKGHRRVPTSQLLLRGAASAIANGVALTIAANGMPVFGGLVSAFPAIFLTTMIGTWIAQGHEVPIGAVAPMILGATSVGLFALLGIWLFPLMGPALGIVVCWLLAVSFVTAPLMYSMRRVTAISISP